MQTHHMTVPNWFFACFFSAVYEESYAVVFKEYRCAFMYIDVLIK